MTKPMIPVSISPLPPPSAEGLVSKELWRQTAEVIHNVVIPVLGGISVVLFYVSIFFWNAYLVIPLVGSLALGFFFWALVDEPAKVPSTPSAHSNNLINTNLAKKPKSPPNEPTIEPSPVSDEASELDEPSKLSSSSTSLWPWHDFLSLAPVFEDHPGIQNDGSSCFMNAAFQVFMNLPAYQEALLEEIRYRTAQLAVFQKMEVFFQGNSNAQDLIECSLPEKHFLLNAFLSQRIYNELKNKFPNDNAKIAVFLGYLKRFLEAGEREAPSHEAAKLFWQILPQIVLNSHIKAILLDCLGEHFKQIGKMLEIGKFINEYTEAKAAKTSCVGSLTALRKLLDERFQEGQQDTSEWLANFFQLFAPYRYPDLYFPLSLHKRYALNEDLTKENKNALEALQTEVQRGIKVPYDEEALDRVKTDYTNRLDVYIEGNTLEQLISNFFAINAQENSSGFVMKKNAKLCMYKTVSQQYSLRENELPKRFFCTLKRFSGYPGKDTTEIDVSEEITIAGKRYKVAAAIIHHGSSIMYGHYTSITKNERGEWFHNDDSRIQRISQEDALTKMKDGYVFFLEESV